MNKGFTLVELLAVIVVIGVILSIAVPNIISTSKKTRDNMYEAKVKIIEKAAELYGNDRYDLIKDNYQIVTLSTLIENNYLKKDDKNCTNDCVKDPRTNQSMDNQKVCICVVNKNIEASFIGTNSNCNETICDPD